MGCGLDASRGAWGGRRARWATAGLVVVAVGTSATWYAVTRDQPAAAVAPGRSVVGRGSVTAEIAATGTAVPAQSRSLSFAVASTVIRVSVRPGDTVTPGQELAAVDATTAGEQLTQAKESLADAQDTLVAARDAADETEDCATGSADSTGSSGSSGSVRPAAASGDTGPVRLASAADTGPVRLASAADTGPVRLASASNGVPAGVVAPETARASPTPSATAPTPQPTVSRPQSGPTTTTRPGGTGGTGGTDGTDTGGTGTGDGAGTTGGCTSRSGGTDQILGAQQRVNSAQQQVDEATEQLAGATITAPFAGKVLSVAGMVGGTVSAGSAFIQVADVNGMQVSASFPEADAGRLAERQKAVVTLPALPGEQFPATVVQVDPAGTTSGTMVTYGALLSFTKAPADMLVGQSANVRVTTAETADVLRVPATAVREIRDGAGVVMVPTPDGSERRQVTVGLRGDQYIEIRSGLTEGEEVLTSW